MTVFSSFLLCTCDTNLSFWVYTMHFDILPDGLYTAGFRFQFLVLDTPHYIQTFGQPAERDRGRCRGAHCRDSDSRPRVLSSSKKHMSASGSSIATRPASSTSRHVSACEWQHQSKVVLALLPDLAEVQQTGHDMGF